MATEQKPLNSGFGPKTTAKEVLAGLDLTGKIAVVTGGYSGVGHELTGVLPWAIDSELAERLWSLSENLTGVKFDRNCRVPI